MLFGCATAFWLFILRVDVDCAFLHVLGTSLELLQLDGLSTLL